MKNNSWSWFCVLLFQNKHTWDQVEYDHKLLQVWAIEEKYIFDTKVEDDMMLSIYDENDFEKWLYFSESIFHWRNLIRIICYKLKNDLILRELSWTNKF